MVVGTGDARAGGAPPTTPRERGQGRRAAPPGRPAHERCSELNFAGQGSRCTVRPAFPIGTRFWNQGSSLESCKDAGAARRLLVACALLVACGLLVACALLVASEMLHRVALLASCALGLQRGPRRA